MTTIDVPDLLSQYGDALEAEHPMPRSAANVGADGKPLLSVPTGRIDPLGNIVLLSEQAPNRKRRVLMAAAVVIVAGLAAIGASAAIRTDETVDTAQDPTAVGQPADIPVELQPFVFPGETVLRTDPLVVIAAPPVELNFDTSDLGTETSFDPVDSLSSDQLDVLIDNALERFKLDIPGRSPFTQRKLTLLWVEGDFLGALGVADTVITESDDDLFQLPGSIGSTFRESTRISSGSAVGSGDLVEQPDDPDGFIVPPTVEEHLNLADPDGGRYPVLMGASYGEPFTDRAFHLDYDVAREVAAVQMVIDEQSVWMRPVAGRVVLSGEGSINDKIELVTYNLDGEELTRRLSTVQGG